MTTMTTGDAVSLEKDLPDRPRVSSRPERLLGAWRRFELPIGLLLVAAGFVGVALGWYDASGTADVRRQLQALISGGFGGLAAVVLGVGLIQTHVASKNSRELAGKFERVADALLDLAYSTETPAPASVAATDTQQIPRASSPQAVTHVLASHASYHVPGCDLTRGREDLRELTVNDAEAEDLRPCGVCLSSRVVTS